MIELENSRRTYILVVIILMVILTLIGLTWGNYSFSVENPGGNDFLARWMGARYWLVEGVSPYDEQVSLASQNMIYGHPADPSMGEDVAHFVYPLYSMLFFGVFGLLEYLPARAIWMTLLEISLIFLVIVSLRLVDRSISLIKITILVIISLFWYFGVRTIIVGQFAGINALLIVVSLLLIIRKQDILAGFILALTTSKPQMTFLLVVFVFLWAISVRRRELWVGIVVGMVILLGFSLILLPDWPLQMLRQVIDYPNYTSIGSPLSIIADLTPGIRNPVNLFLHLVFVIYLLVEWYLAWGKNENHFLWTAMLTLVITNLVAFRTATTNYVILLPVLLYIFKILEVRWGTAGGWIALISILGIGIGSWVLFLGTKVGNVEHPIMYIPLPFICLMGLLWIRWWAIKYSNLVMTEMTNKFV